jgi:gluconolactonase
VSWLAVGPLPAPIRHPVPEDLRLITSKLRFPEGPIACTDGSVLVVEVRGEALTRVLPDGQLQTVAHVPGGPNGAAVGPDGAVYVCNNGGLPWTQLPDQSWYPVDARTGSMCPEGYIHGWIERVDPTTGTVDRLYESDGEAPLSAPNDLAFSADGIFWFTDTGKTDATSSVLGRVCRASPDGSSIATVASGLLGPNGVGLSPDGAHLYVADTPSGRLWRWSLSEGQLDGQRPRHHDGTVVTTVPGATPLDSLAVDAEGRIVVALPGDNSLAIISPDGGLSILEMPGPMTTNLCFGGEDRSTAFVTLGGRGQLVSFRWPCPGAELPYAI